MLQRIGPESYLSSCQWDFSILLQGMEIWLSASFANLATVEVWREWSVKSRLSGLPKERGNVRNQQRVVIS